MRHANPIEAVAPVGLVVPRLPSQRLPRHVVRITLACVAALASGCSEEPAPQGQAAIVEGALTVEQCEFFQVNNRVTICHWNEPRGPHKKDRKRYDVIKTNLATCGNHASHPNDYVAYDDRDCDGSGCFPIGAPYDGSVECCAGLAPVDGYCADIDECAAGTDECPANTGCTNDVGGYTCACAPGFVEVDEDEDDDDDGDGECGGGGHHHDDDDDGHHSGDGQGHYDHGQGHGYGHDHHDHDDDDSGLTLVCVDVDECASDAHGCASDADCLNLPGTFACVCRDGFVGDGFTCSPACAPADCDDADPCTVDACAPGGGCAHDPAPPETACDTGDACRPGHCGFEVVDDVIVPSGVCVPDDPCANGWLDGLTDGYNAGHADGPGGSCERDDEIACCDGGDCAAEPACSAICDGGDAYARAYVDGFLEGYNYGYNEDGVCQRCCPAGYTGPTCEDDVDECALGTPCGEHGACDNTHGAFACICDAGWVDASLGGDVTAVIGGRTYGATIPAASFVTESGAPIEGAGCDLRMDVTPEGFAGSMFDADGNEVELAALADFSFTTVDGERAVVAPGATVTIRIPIAEGAGIVEVGDPIELWAYDDGLGIWALESVGVVEADAEGFVAVGAATHFTWYGVAPTSKSCVKVTVKNPAGQGVGGVKLRAAFGSAYYQPGTTTAADGRLCLQARASAANVISVVAPLPPGYAAPAPVTLPSATAVAGTCIGTTCQTVTITLIDIDACLGNPCDVDASCTDLPAPALDAPSGRTCQCDAGFQGTGEPGDCQPVCNAIGQSAGGGVVFYIDGDCEEGYVADPNISCPDCAWGHWRVGLGDGFLDVPGTGTAVGTGPANSAMIAAAWRATDFSGVWLERPGHPIGAEYCDDLVLNGHDDWFLPSKDEMYLMYSNIGLEGGHWYYTSSQAAVHAAWMQHPIGEQSAFAKYYYQPIRCARPFRMSDPPAGLAYPVTSASYLVDRPIQSNVPVSSGGAITSFTISPALPAGLSFSATTGVISGTPTALSSLRSYTIVGTSATGSTSTTIALAVVLPAPPAGLSYPTNPAVYLLDNPFTPNVPTSTGGPIYGYTITPNLPDYLSFSTTDGTISGWPSTLSPTTTYTVTATNPAGSTSTTVTITVSLPPAPSGLSFADDPAVYDLGDHVYNPLSSTGGPIDSCDITPALPDGLWFDPWSCVIIGSASQASPPTAYTVTATNVSGSATTTLTLSVVAPLPPAGLTFDVNPADYELGEHVYNPMSSTGGPIDFCSISPALPDGLWFDPWSCTIMGVTAQAWPSTAHTVTATNPSGSATTTLTLSVVAPLPPAGLTFDENPADYELGEHVHNSVSSTGGPIDYYDITPDLPDGLFFDSHQGTLMGHCSAVSPTTQYTVTGYNASGSDSVTLTLTVHAPPPPSGLVYGENPATYQVGDFLFIPLSTSGGPIESFSVSPSLPSGLSLFPDGAIFGAADSASPQTDYVVTAHGPGGDASVTLTLTITP